jgi:hypothetical protein
MKLNSLAILYAVGCQAPNPLWTPIAIWVTMAAPEISAAMPAKPGVRYEDRQSFVMRGGHGGGGNGREGKKITRRAERT